MKKSIAISILSLVFTILQSASAFADAAAHYQALVQRAWKHDPTLNYAELRTAFSKTKAWEENQELSQLTAKGFDEIDAKRYDVAKNYAKILLENNFASPRTHLFMETLYFYLGDKTAQENHKEIRRQLLLSIFKGGDGKSPTTAYRVITIAEIYDLLQSIGGKSEGVKTVEVGGHTFDIIRARIEGESSPRMLYFNVDVPVSAEKKLTAEIMDRLDAQKGKNSGKSK